MKQVSAALTLFLLSAVSLFGYGHEGHQAIGEIARPQLSPVARAAVTKLLGNDNLAAIATWLDDVRSAERHSGPLVRDPAVLDFIRRFPGSKDWHFVNFPAGSTTYDPNSPFATTNDVVHALGLALVTLEGQDTGLTKPEALKVLIHLVGDLHQPLHTVTGYYDLTDPQAPRLLAPSEATTDSPEDAGGSGLFYTKSQELHALWDTGLLQRVSSRPDYKSLAAACVQQHPDTTTASPGDYHYWAATWAAESIRLGGRPPTPICTSTPPR